MWLPLCLVGDCGCLFRLVGESAHIFLPLCMRFLLFALLVNVVACLYFVVECSCVRLCLTGEYGHFSLLYDECGCVLGLSMYLMREY